MSQPKPSAVPCRRGASRLKTFQVGLLAATDTHARVHILNLSIEGASCHAEQPPANGQAIRLEFAELVMSARVIWGEGPRFGVRFDTALGADTARAAAEYLARTPGPV